MSNLVVEDKEKHIFEVHRSVFTDQEVLDEEMDKIFSTCWLYVGHESELPNKGDFKRRKVGGRNLIFTRSNDGKIRVLFNTCPHRGAMVTREKQGNARVFQCFYHAWTFNNEGKLVGLPEKDSFPKCWNANGEKDLLSVERLENYRGFIFINFDNDACSLEEYLGNAKEYLDLVIDQSEAGMEIIGDPQEYSMHANWKLLSENSMDSYHGAPTHKTYFEALAERGGELSKEHLKGYGRDLGNGHGVVEYKAPWGRPVAKWAATWGEDAKEEIDKIYNRLVEKHGEERAKRIAHNSRNLLIFPNLVINDIMGITVRTFFPEKPGYMEVNGWALGPVDENKQQRKNRMDNWLEFLGPGGFATPDDNEALELCQEGYEKNNREVAWNDISKGMINENPLSSDEEQMRGFWRQWRKLMEQ